MKEVREKFIGIFDSGLGGLDIMRSITKELPQYNYIFLGDNARVPYGSRTKDIIYKFTKQAVDFLFNHNCQIVILACNTISCEALRRIQREYIIKKYPDKKVLGVLIPASEEAVRISKNEKVGVIATQNSVASGAFKREILKLNSKIKVYQKACPRLVPIIEKGRQCSEVVEMVLRKYLRVLIKNEADTIILGCTHYGFLEKEIKKIVGKNIKIISEAKIVPKKLKKYLEKHTDIESKLGKKSIKIFYATNPTARLKLVGEEFFGKSFKIKKAKLV